MHARHRLIRWASFSALAAIMAMLVAYDPAIAADKKNDKKSKADKTSVPSQDQPKEKPVTVQPTTTGSRLSPRDLANLIDDAIDKRLTAEKVSASGQTGNVRAQRKPLSASARSGSS